MIQKYHTSGIIVFLSGFLTTCSMQSNFSVLKGPYLGQKPPGMTPEIFAPGIVSTGLSEQRISFSADGREVFFNSSIMGPFTKDFLFYSHLENDVWTEPVEFSFQTGRPDFGRAMLNPDGSKVFFQSGRIDGQSNGQSSNKTIWYMSRTHTGWATPQQIHFEEDFRYRGHPSVAANGNLYFQGRPSAEDDADIYVSRYDNGRYAEPAKLSGAINGPGHDCHPCIAPDESFLIFDARRPDDGLGAMDLYISFRDETGEWMKAKNMGPKVNSAGDERRSFVTFDGKYLFFIGYVDGLARFPDRPVTLGDVENINNMPENGLYDVYWVEAAIIDELRQDEI